MKLSYTSVPQFLKILEFLQINKLNNNIDFYCDVILDDESLYYTIDLKSTKAKKLKIFIDML